MRKLILVMLLGCAALSGCVVEPVGGPYYYGHPYHHCGYYHCW
jgi:hypothetical protein